MATVTVKQLAETVKVPVDRLLKQMQEAGLEHNADGDLVSEEEKQQLLGYLQKSHGESQDSKKKITLKRKSTGTIKQGQGRAGRDVTVEVRRKRTYVKKQDVVDESAENNEEPTVKQAEVEVRKIHEEESARQEAEEKARLEKEEALVASQRKAEKKIQEEADKKKQEELIKNNSDEQKTGQNSTEKVANAAEVQAQVQAAEKGNRRTRSKDKNGDAADEFGDGKGKRRELSLKSR